jgi:TNF receptor-associated protein 1
MLSRAAFRFARSSASPSTAGAISANTRPVFSARLPVSVRAFASGPGPADKDDALKTDDQGNPLPNIKDAIEEKKISFDEQEFDRLMDEAMAKRKLQGDTQEALGKLPKGGEGKGAETSPVPFDGKKEEEEVDEDDEEDIVVEEPLSGAEHHSFQAETTQLLRIVTHSLYKDKEVFLRELISNAADAIEKFRHMQTSGVEVRDGDRPMEIRISTNKAGSIITIEDTGIGLSKEELCEHLGTIARSGSKAFLEKAKKELDDKAEKDGEESSPASAAANIIGQFGVGFYAAFMVADRVRVTSRSALSSNNSAVHVWESTGSGDFAVRELEEGNKAAEGLIGTKVTLYLRKDDQEFGAPTRLDGIVNQYSNFVGYPIFLNGKRVNTVEAVWARDPSTVSDDEYSKFYQYQTKSVTDPSLRLHFRTDAPIDLKALLFVPESHGEKSGMERMKRNVSLYSRKVLLGHGSDKLLPEWLRFVHGAIDSEDLPISLSRETMQDSRLLERINHTVTRKFIRFLQNMNKKDTPKYQIFFDEFGRFIKEGVCMDFTNQKDLAKLLRFHSSRMGPNEMTSFDEYISRLAPEQDKIYYLTAPSRELALASPYFEVFQSNNIEVLFLSDHIDDFVMTNLQEFGGRQLVTCDSGLDLNMKKKKKKAKKDGETDVEDKEGEEETDESADVDGKLSKEEEDELKFWLADELGEFVLDVKCTNRLVSTPAIVVDHESAAVRRMTKLVSAETGEQVKKLGKQKLEINANHPIMISLNELRLTKPDMAGLVARQIFDNALIAAGLVDDPREMVPRLNGILAGLLKTDKKK